VQTLSFTIIAAQFALMLFFARNRRMWQVMAANGMLLLAVLTLSVTVWDMDRERNQLAVAINALTRLHDQMALFCK
jgi:predicted lysophospholipase L1 biosynthesis ABC-type transport system permease subunit